ncbi:MAG TPA: hypothetical protein VF965_03310 [Candidatus Limnocylindria bacterium]
MLRPRLWVSLVPYGIGRTKPNHYLIAAGRRDPVSGVPDYNAVVEISRA